MEIRKYKQLVEENFNIGIRFDSSYRIYKLYKNSHWYFVDVESWMNIFKKMDFQKVDMKTKDKHTTQAFYLFGFGEVSYQVCVSYTSDLQAEKITYSIKDEGPVTMKDFFSSFLCGNILSDKEKKVITELNPIGDLGVQLFLMEYLEVKLIKRLQKIYEANNQIQSISHHKKEKVDSYLVIGKLKSQDYALRIDVPGREEATFGFAESDEHNNEEICRHLYWVLYQDFLNIGFAMSRHYVEKVLKRIIVEETIRSYQKTKEYKLKKLFVSETL